MTSINPSLGHEFEPAASSHQADPVLTGVEVEYADPNQQALAGVVDKLESFKANSRIDSSGYPNTRRLADTQILQGEGVAVDPGRFATDIHEYFGPSSHGVTQHGHSALMDELLPSDGSQRARTTRYRLGGGIGLQVDAMSKIADGQSTWVRVMATRE